MALASGIALPLAAQETLRAVLDAIPQKELVTYAATGSAFAGGGFRTDRLPAIRARIAQIAAGSEPIDDDLRRLLVCHIPGAAIVNLLSEAAVRANLRYLGDLFGHGLLLLSLQLDPRFADLAQTEAEKASHICDKDDADTIIAARAEAVRALREELWPILHALDADTGGDGSGGATSTRFEKLVRHRELAAEVARLKGADTRLEKERGNREKAEDEARRWRGRAEEAEKALGSLRQRAEVAEAALARCRREADKVADARVETRLAREFAEWLGDKRAALVREAASEAASDALLARAKAALARQAASDRAAGTRQALETRLAALEETRRQCGALLADALAPTDELRAVEADLAAEVRRLRLLLGAAAPASSANAEEALLKAVNAAEARDLPDLEHTARRLRGLDLIDDDALARLAGRIRGRYAALYARRGGPGLETGDAATPEYILRCALEGRTPLVLLVDGHNTLFALQSRYCRPQDHRGPSSEDGSEQP